MHDAKNAKRLQLQQAMENKTHELYNKYTAEGRIRGSNEMQAMRFDELATSVTDPATKQSYLNLAKKMRSPEMLELMMNQQGYTTSMFKKGGTLRPTSDQMLIDNGKLVAKAIEKLNDNTMKLILKALS